MMISVGAAAGAGSFMTVSFSTRRVKQPAVANSAAHIAMTAAKCSRLIVSTFLTVLGEQ
jgi:uncharacterized membrane protein